MIKINSDNIITGQIKELLSSFNLPSFIVLRDFIKVDTLPTGSNIIEGQKYLCDNILYVAVKIDDVLTFKNILVNNKVYVNKNVVYLSYKEGNTIKLFKTSSSYKWNKYSLNLTHTMPIKSNIYDKFTHNYLGNYLRFLRDYKDTDLMSLYNCFCGDMPRNFEVSINVNNKTVKFDSSDELYSIYMLPVKFNKKYTIAIDSSSPVEIICYFNEEGQFKQHDMTITKTYMKRGSSIFSKPFLYDRLTFVKNTQIIDPNILKHQENLYMFIKVNCNINNNIVVLEGDYTDSSNIFINDNANTEVKYRPTIISNDGNSMSPIYNVSRPELLYLTTDTYYVLSDRIVEYLFNNVIDKNDEITNNIKKVQDKLFSNGLLPDKSNYGLWSNKIKAGIILTEHKHKSHREIFKDFDMLGDYDKSVENMLGSFEEE